MYQLETNAQFLCFCLSLLRFVHWAVWSYLCSSLSNALNSVHAFRSSLNQTLKKKSVLSNQVPFKFRRLVGSRWDFLEPVRCQGGSWTWERPNQIPHSDQSRSWFCCMIDSRAFLTPPMSQAFPTDLPATLHPLQPSPPSQPRVCLKPD